MEHLCCSCTFQSIMLEVHVHGKPIKHWASASFDLDSQMAHAGVAPPALAEMCDLHQDLPFCFCECWKLRKASSGRMQTKGCPLRSTYSVE